MGVKIGIPRALLYYNYYPAWKRFFEELGLEVVVSRKSCKEILDNGVRLAVNEACLPVKIFYGHILDLKEKADYLFVPRVVSVEKKAYICPKFLGLPDMVRRIEGLPPIIDTNIDLRKSKIDGLKAALEVGKQLEISPWQCIKAYRRAIKSLQEFEKILGDLPDQPREKRQDLSILFLGHSYNLYDYYLSRGLLEKAQKLGVKIVTSYSLEKTVLKEYWKKFEGKMFWTFGRQNWGAADYYLSNGGIDGIIYLAAFGCGPDSLFGELIEKRVRRLSKMPYMYLNIDEHTGEAGLITRLEAFVDMLRWRQES